MAKGDNKKAQTQIDTQGRIAQGGINSLNNTFYPQYGQMYNNYLYGTGRNLEDYDSIMNQYRSFFQNPYQPYNPQQYGGMYNQQPNNMRPGQVGVGVSGSTPVYAPGAKPDVNQQGQGPNLDPAYLTQTISDAWRRIRGGEIPPDQLQYWMGKATTPDTYSDNKVRVGWNPYWESRMVANDTGSSDPRLAGDEGVIGYGGGQQSIFGGGPYGPALSQALAGYSDFANTGGFSPQNLQDIRARAVAPIRSIYSGAQRELDRSRRLGGGAANYGAALSKMAREQSYNTADAMQNQEGALAQMIQQGRLAGLGGLSQMGLTGSGQELTARLGALSGMSNLYGTTPGLANMFGNQVLNAGNQLLNTQELQNQLGLGLMGGQINKGQIPGDFSQAMGNIGSVIGLGSQLISPLGSIFGGGGGAQVPNLVPGNWGYQPTPQITGQPISLGYR